MRKPASTPRANAEAASSSSRTSIHGRVLRSASMQFMLAYGYISQAPGTEGMGISQPPFPMETSSLDARMRRGRLQRESTFLRRVELFHHARGVVSFNRLRQPRRPNLHRRASPKTSFSLALARLYAFPKMLGQNSGSSRRKDIAISSCFAESGISVPVQKIDFIGVKVGVSLSVACRGLRRGWVTLGV
jgi:hypothetical protein